MGVEEAGAGTPRAADHPHSIGPELTKREMQVAALVAEGHSNKDIAALLVVSPRTVGGHIERILAKLGFAKRSQIAAWTVGSGSSAGTSSNAARSRPKEF